MDLNRFPEIISDEIDKLFSEAKENGGLEYIFTIVRLDGITYKKPDPLMVLNENIEKYEKYRESDLEEFFSSMEFSELFRLLLNLCYCASGKNYICSPFTHLRKGDFFDPIEPSGKDIIEYTKKIVKDLNQIAIFEILEGIFSKDLLKKINADENILYANPNNLYLFYFVRQLLQTYNNEKLKFHYTYKFHKLPRFEVLELITNEIKGLYGFIIHFSNGTNARFIREEDNTSCINILLRDQINFNVGLIDDLKDIWMVGNKPLYEIGLPGSYNPLGEWKPIIYPGKYDEIQKEAYSCSSNPDVQGCLFYIMCTCYHVIEFVVKAGIEFPEDHISYGDKLYLYKCKEEESIIEPNVYIYDGRLQLETIDAEYIQSALNGINSILNSISFFYETPIEWELKYTGLMRGRGAAQAKKEDFKIYNKIADKLFLKEELLNRSIDWYINGLRSNNIFNSYLCYYIAIENAALAIVEHKISSNIDIPKKTKAEKKDERVKCIIKKYHQLFEDNKIRFVEESYSICLKSINKQMRFVLEKIFGKEHKYIDLIFNKKDGYSLSDLRSRIAHGRISLMDQKHAIIVQERIGEIAEISKNFLLRLILDLKPEENIPKQQQIYRVMFSMSNPKNTLIANNEKVFPNKDWKIKREWV